MKKFSIFVFPLFIISILSACEQPKTSISVTVQTAASNAYETASPSSNNPATVSGIAQTTIIPSHSATPSSSPTTTEKPKNSASNKRASETLPNELLFSDTIITNTPEIDENNAFTTILTSTTNRTSLVAAYQKALVDLNVANFSEATQGDNWGFIGELDGQVISGIIAPDTENPNTAIIEITIQE